MPGELDAIVQRMIDAGESEDNIALVIREYGAPPKQATPPPASATIGMMAPSTVNGDPARQNPANAGIGSDRVRGWMDQMDQRSGELRQDAVEHPIRTAAVIAAPLALKAVPGIVAGGKELGARAVGISKARAGTNIDAALKAGNGLRVPQTPGSQDAAMRAKELTGTSNSELNRFFDRLTNPKVTKYRGDDLSVREAQDFVMKFGAMSADDALKLPAAARPEITKLVQELRSALAGTLDTVGKGAQYTRGVDEYRKAMRAAEIWEKAKPSVMRWARWLGGAAVAGGAAGHAYGSRD